MGSAVARSLCARRIRDRRTRQGAEETRRWTVVLRVCTERVAVGHLSELPHALSTDGCLSPVAIKIAWRTRRRDGAARERARAACGFAGRRISLELDLRIGLPTRRRLLLQERRG